MLDNPRLFHVSEQQNVLFLVTVALSASGPVTRSQVVAPEQLAALKAEEGRELRVVMNTNDPDYEHIYSIDSYDDPLDELLYFPPADNQTDGVPDGQESQKTGKVEAKKVPNVVKVGGDRGAKVPTLKKAKSRPVRSTKGAKGQAPADICLQPMEEGSCVRFTLRWYFNSRVQACRPFIYSGCGGNDNSFLHLEQCEELCLGKAEGSPLLR
ncbi:anticoagulant protein rhipilin-1 [Corythoichthys intestinalis]|uniref:anticoagulant protein rhipilin-1 n=1 Tax=Corythoichthys intestinalis TaxID=161448 RepID=UPI0025A58052|nr:anticoagulant protein rhipilin-1 [Corythoichthys intestinalis]